VQIGLIRPATLNSKNGPAGGKNGSNIFDMHDNHDGIGRDLDYIFCAGHVSGEKDGQGDRECGKNDRVNLSVHRPHIFGGRHNFKGCKKIQIIQVDTKEKK
jgi:hypothetical protein